MNWFVSDLALLHHETTTLAAPFREHRLNFVITKIDASSEQVPRSARQEDPCLGLSFELRSDHRCPISIYYRRFCLIYPLVLDADRHPRASGLSLTLDAEIPSTPEGVHHVSLPPRLMSARVGDTDERLS